MILIENIIQEAIDRKASDIHLLNGLRPILRVSRDLIEIPDTEIVRMSSGSLKEKKKTQTTLKQEYVYLVFGLAIFISANIFNISPSIKNIVFSGYTHRRNKMGEIHDEYVYSIKFTRGIFEKSSLVYVDPKDFCMRFENRCNITSTMLMKKITPYDLFGK